MTTSDKSKVVVRFAPSPTGNFHLGSARTALFNFLFARHAGGKFILRIDDTDRERSQQKYEDDIIAGLAWLGLTYDECYRQSARQELYQSFLEKLIAQDLAYWSKEQVVEAGDRDKVIRFRNPGRQVKVTDDIIFDTTELGDFIIAKDLQTPLYHFASVVDDFDLGITQVIRGEDHLSNTPRQILLAEAIGAPVPTFIHIPLILAPDKSKLSKRHGALPVTTYRDQGFLPQALNNFVALLGWSPQALGLQQEVFSLTELIEVFNGQGWQSSAAVFDEKKLLWLNREHLKKLNQEEFLSGLKNFLPAEFVDQPWYRQEILEKIQPLLLERLSLFSEVTDLVANDEMTYFFHQPQYPAERLRTVKYLPEVLERLSALSDDEFKVEHIKQAIWDYATSVGRGEVLWPMRVALSGLEKSPDPFTLAAILGREETLKRITYAISRGQT